MALHEAADRSRSRGATADQTSTYFGATGGGLWKTSDGGVTWRPVSDGFFKSSSVGAVAVAESQPDVVYAGMGEVQLRGNVIQGDGVYKSTDAGRTWTHVGLARSMAIGRIRVHPANPDVVYVAALGDPYGPSAERGVFKSTDGGKTWDGVLFRNNQAGAVDLSMDPKNPEVLYAGFWEVFRTPHSLSSGGPGSGLFKTTDGGKTWTELTKNPGLPAPLWGKVGVSVSGADSSRVYAIIEAADGGVFLSNDAGATWTRVNEDRRLRQRAFYYTRIYADPKARDTVYVLNTGIYRSTDAGKTLTAIRVPHGDNHDLWIAGSDPARMINSNDGGANVSTNAGESWTDQDYPTAQFYNVFTTAHVPYHVCGAQQDNSTACVPSAGGGELYQVGGGESGYVAPDPRDVDVFYAGSYGGLLTRINRRTGERRAINIWPDNPMGFSASDMTERFQWTFPIVIAPTDPRTSVRDVAARLEIDQRRPELAAHQPGSDAPRRGDPRALGRADHARSNRRRNLCDGLHPGALVRQRQRHLGRIRRRARARDARRRKDVDERHPGGPARLHAHQPHRCLAARRGHRVPRGQPVPAFGSCAVCLQDVGLRQDAGRRSSTASRPDDFSRAVREDPKRRGLLFLGTETGFYVSFDDGGSWQTLQTGLPVTPVHGIQVKNDDIVIGTHGRSFYVMPNIGILRQVSREMTNEAVVLFDPADAVRSVSPTVTIDYYLKQAADKVTLEILDAQSKTITTFTGTPGQPAGRGRGDAPGGGEDEEGGGGRGAPPPRVGVAAGMNRFSWDLRYPNARDFPGLILWAGSTRGPIAPPGRYKVTLTAQGVSKTQEFAVVRNTNVPAVTDQDLIDQFTLAKQINDRITVAHDAVLSIRSLKEQIAARTSSDARLNSYAESITQKLTDVEGEIYQYRNRSNQDPLNYPIRLNNKLAALQGIVESGDAKPTDQSYAVFKDLSARLDRQLARLDALRTSDLAEFNKVLAERKMELIMIFPRAPR